MENNRQFELMRSAARQKLEGADPVHLSTLTGLCWDGRTFDTETLGIPIRISWPECQISPALEMWHDLTILQYLANTKGTTLMGKFLALSEFHAGGLAKGTSFDRDNDRMISRIGLHDPQAIREAAAKLGGTELYEKIRFVLFVFLLPHIPIKFNLWLPDEEFPASGKVLFDASAENDLQIEAAGTAAAICLSLWKEAYFKRPTGGTASRLVRLLGEGGIAPLNALRGSIAQFQLERRKITKEEIVDWVGRYKDGNINDPDYRREIIDTFVNSVFVYDDKLILTYNYKDGSQTLTLQEIEAALSSDLTGMCPPKKNRSTTLRGGASFLIWTIRTRTHLDATVRWTVAEFRLDGIHTLM